MAIILEEIYEVALHRYNMKLVAGGRGLRNLVDWVHTVEEMDYVSFFKRQRADCYNWNKEKDEEMLECFVKSLYEAGASGLVINVGKYITRVPHSVITYSEEVGFPIFVLPWEVHLVDFNRDLCNLIYKTMQEQDSLETALQKAIFSHKEEQQYMPVLHENQIHKDTEIFMVQCYFPAGGNTQAERNFDNTQFFYRFIRQCQQIFAHKKVQAVVFQKDLYITLIARISPGKERTKIAEEIAQLSQQFSRQKKVYIAIGDERRLCNSLGEIQRFILLCAAGAEKKISRSVRKRNWE